MKKWLVTIIVALDLIGSNVYRYFPLAEGEAKMGDKIYYYFQSVIWILFVIALRQNNNDNKDRIILTGYLSLLINSLADELFFNVTKVSLVQIVATVFVVLITCTKEKVYWLWQLLIVLIIIGLMLIK